MAIATATAIMIAAGVAAASTAYSAYAQKEAAADQRDAQNKATAEAEKNAKLADEASNRANQRRPDVNSILSAAGQAARGGSSGTMLTGPQGAGADAGSLGKTSLLGG